MAEVFKRAALLELIRAPHHELGHQQLEHLVTDGQWVGAPKTGPVRTDDVADAMINATSALLGDNHAELFDRLSALRVRGSQPGGILVTTVPGQARPAATSTSSSSSASSAAPAGRGASNKAWADPPAITAAEDDFQR